MPWHMTKANAVKKQRATDEVPIGQWMQFLAEFTQANRGAHALLEVTGPDVGYQVETADRLFDGVAADIRKNSAAHAVWITFGSKPADHITHGVHDAVTIRTLPRNETRGAVLDVEAQNGVRTVLELSLPEAYELPPGSE